jgi:AcrR family transcriptional regulator
VDDPAGQGDRAGATATALLDAAEQAFAAGGVEHASLRAIMREAGANPAAVHYHFGSRDELARAVLDRTLAPLNARRLELLGEAEAATRTGAPIPLFLLLDALVRPDIEAAAELARRGRGRGRLIGLIYSRPERFVTSLVEQHFAPVAASFMPHLAAAVPGVEPSELSWRVRWCVFGVLGALLSATGPGDDLDPGDIDHTVARIVTVTAAALASPPPETASRPQGATP